MKLLGQRLGLAVLLALSVLALGARKVVLAQETDDPVKIEIYKRFVDNRQGNPAVAYQAARDYLQKYNKDKDQYTDYLGKWVILYERDARKRNLANLINEKKFAEAYSTGAKILADEPNYLRAQIDLAYAGYLAASTKNESFNSTALDYAKKAIQTLESPNAPIACGDGGVGVGPAGKVVPVTCIDWAPFKGKDDTLAYLNYAVGFLTLKTNQDQAIDALLKAAKYDSDIKKTPSTYYFLAAAYEAGPYKTLSAAYQTQYAGKPETPESKAALEKLNTVMDRIIDAYARAIATAGTDAKTEQSRKEWLAQMTNYYKFRHDGSDAGLTEFIAASLQKPLPPKP
jgi:tetratricopeptide (TPR) repeat protein